MVVYAVGHRLKKWTARTLGDSLYVDGAITGNILYGGRVAEKDSFLARWRAAYPKDPLPRVRYWVIFNNQLRFPPQITPERWPDIMGRATIMATQTSTVNSMRHLYALAELMRLKYGADVQVRVMAVPDSFVPSKPDSLRTCGMPRPRTCTPTPATRANGRHPMNW